MKKALRDRFGFSYSEAAYLAFNCRELAEHLLYEGTPEEIEKVKAELKKIAHLL